MRAAIYVRVSTKEQAEQGYSLDAQRRACHERVAAEGWTVTVDEWDDESGKRDDREGLQRVLAAVRDAQLDGSISTRDEALGLAAKLAAESDDGS